MDPISEGCRLCLDPFADNFTTIDSPELKAQMRKVFSFPVEPREGYSSGVCQSCSYTISEFFQYSEKVRQNQESLTGIVPNCNPAKDSKISFEHVKLETFSDSVPPETTEDAREQKYEVSGEDESQTIESEIQIESVKIETLSDSGIPETTEDTCGQADTVSGQEDVPHSGDDESYEPPQKKPQTGKLDCPGCDKLFASKKTLKRHVANQHSGSRTMVCKTCGEEFVSKLAFDRHMKGHLGIEVQRFQCGICQRWLKSEQSLRNHMVWVHCNGSQEFQCDVCQQKFPHSQALSCHKFRMHAEPKHECEFCGKKFKKAIALKEHRTTHTGEVLYACKYCGLANNRKQNFYRHIKREHPTEWAQMKLMATPEGGPS